LGEYKLRVRENLCTRFFSLQRHFFPNPAARRLKMFHLYQLITRLEAGLSDKTPSSPSKLNTATAHACLALVVSLELLNISESHATNHPVTHLADPVGESSNDVDSADPAPPATWVPPMGASRLTWHNIMRNKNNIDYW